MKITFRVDDLGGEPTRALIAHHLTAMQSHSPAKCAHALDLDGLRADDMTLWSAWMDDEIAGCGALKQLDAERGEIKSMRVADRFLGRGVGRAMLVHLLNEARLRGMRSIWLETGSSEPFAPALRLYESAGFTRCGAFGGYVDNAFSVFMMRALETDHARL